MSLERAYIGGKQAKADCAAAVAIVDAVDQRRQFLAPAAIGVEQARLVLAGGHQVEQHHAHAQRLIARDALPELLEAGEQLSSSHPTTHLDALGKR